MAKAPAIKPKSPTELLDEAASCGRTGSRRPRSEVTVLRLETNLERREMTETL